jgi:AcrR family transcriptional regulator
VSRALGRPRGTRPGETRAALVEAARRVFAEDGYRGGSLARIADGVGVTQAAVLHHFGSKDALLAEVLRARDAVDARELVEDGQPPAVGFEILDRLLMVVEHNTRREGLVRLYVTMAGEAIDADSPARDWLADHFARGQAVVVAALRRGMAAGSVRPDTPVLLVGQVVAAVLDGLQVQWLLDPDGVDMVAAASQAFAGLRNRWELPGPAARRRDPA